MIGRTKGERIFDLFNVLFLIFLMIITIYPLLYVLFASLSDPRLLMKHEGPILWPLGSPTLAGYTMTFQNPNILIGYRNTLFYVVAGTALNIFMTALAAFVLSRRDFYIKKMMMTMIVITMFFNGGLIPMFFVIRILGMYDTIWALVFPVAINSWNVIIMRTFFLSIPDSLEESAIIDGANDWTVLFRIILPLSKPVIAVMILYYGVGHWNSWFNAMVFLRDRALFPLQLFLRELLIESTGGVAAQSNVQRFEESYTRTLVQYCTIVVSTVPILCIYPFLQKYFVKGVMIGALKG